MRGRVGELTTVSKFQIGDLVVLKSGSMRMCVEDVTEDGIATVWCNEGVIGRDLFNPALLNKWEFREDGRGGDRAGRPHGGDRDGGAKPYRGGRGREERPQGGDERPRKTGWDGKPRDKKHFRKDD